jgi:hypothetical protein
VRKKYQSKAPEDERAEVFLRGVLTEITALLLAHGADTRQAIALAAQNYGLHDVSLADENDVGMPPWQLIAKAHAQRYPEPS